MESRTNFIKMENIQQEEERIEKFSRQYKLIHPEVLDSVKIICVGAGVGGSWEIYCLCKMGVSNVEVYDGDSVEIANTPQQLYGIHDVGKPKVIALAERIKQDVGIDIITHNERVDENTEFDITGNTIILSQVDSIEARKIIYNKVKGYPVKIIDGRIGGLGYVTYVVDCSNQTECENYEKTFEGTFVTNLSCGLRGIIFSAVNQVTEEVNIIKKILNGEPYPKAIRRDMNHYLLLETK